VRYFIFFFLNDQKFINKFSILNESIIINLQYFIKSILHKRKDLKDFFFFLFFGGKKFYRESIVN
jgi:hypothetical protein